MVATTLDLVALGLDGSEVGGVASADDELPTIAKVHAGYMALQAFGGIVLWMLIDSSSWVRSGFELVPERHAVTNGFFLADLVVIATSILSAWGIHWRRPWAVPMAAATAGGVIYPTSYLIHFVLISG